ncbi:uncharacterized protein JN550_003397 [Neoarthrinium moseri]|uniref:uncharacterized protein n=1 Tax=Neoarthrinium moseri TaxID=1658444 RepID=UPI001FDB5D48|nr:uncharacterized protein JN550_003397 [Neoarthrinium moseri]KAI1873144.1 hypothetical protein JN550_003397 [Neoarthrinium moseri]
MSIRSAKNVSAGREAHRFQESALPSQTYQDRAGMDLLSTENFQSLQHPLSESFFLNMAELESIKCEPTWEDAIDERFSSTPQSDNTQQPEVSGVQPTPRIQPKRRRNTLASAESTHASSSVSREKNRIAASKCRRKKKVEEHQLEERRRMLAVQNSILSDSAAALRMEVLQLKNEVLRHGTCDFPPIQKYIETSAARLT